jgi:hypothetical protein
VDKCFGLGTEATPACSSASGSIRSYRVAIACTFHSSYDFATETSSCCPAHCSRRTIMTDGTDWLKDLLLQFL